MISYHKVWYHIIAAADAAAETGSTNGKPNFFFRNFDFEKWHYQKNQKTKFSKTCLPWSGIKFRIEKWSDHVLIFFSTRFMAFKLLNINNVW